MFPESFWPHWLRGAVPGRTCKPHASCTHTRTRASENNSCRTGADSAILKPSRPLKAAMSFSLSRRRNAIFAGPPIQRCWLSSIQVVPVQGKAIRGRKREHERTAIGIVLVALTFFVLQPAAYVDFPLCGQSGMKGINKRGKSEHRRQLDIPGRGRPISLDQWGERGAPHANGDLR